MTEQAAEDKPILEVAREDPQNVDVDDIVALFDADQGTVRNIALRCLIHVGRDDPDRVADVSDSVIERLDDELQVAGSTAIAVLTTIVSERPDAVRPALPTLVRKLDENPPLTGFRAARTLGPLLEYDPEGFIPEADYLLDVLTDPTDVWAPDEAELQEYPPEERERLRTLLESRREEISKDQKRVKGIQEFAAHALVEVAKREPAPIVDRIDELPPTLSNEPAAGRAATIDILSSIAEDDPEAVQPAVDALIERLEDDVEFVRVHAVRALGFAQATAAIDPLRAVAEDDVDDELQEMAADTADWLAGESS